MLSICQSEMNHVKLDPSEFHMDQGARKLNVVVNGVTNKRNISRSEKNK
jgi:hypothetical protein